MMSYLHTKFHDNWISSFRGVATRRFWEGQTDGVTRLLDLLSPFEMKVKTKSFSDSPHNSAHNRISKRFVITYHQLSRMAAVVGHTQDECWNASENTLKNESLKLTCCPCSSTKPREELTKLHFPH